jgi:glycosyltransferase involved in cell wall biosynthesis
MFISIVVPALNEEITIAQVIENALKGLQKSGFPGEVIIADNGSSDRTILFAHQAGAVVVSVVQKGYGNAIQGGCAKAKGEVIIIADADSTYDLSQIGPFLEKITEGYEFVIGNRYKGEYIPGSMPFTHRYLGTPVLTFIANLLFRSGIGDVNCGMRAFRKDAYIRMNCQSGGMEFASELVGKASLMQLKIAEVPCTLYCSPKGRKAHLRPWRDGGRHLYLLISLFLNRFVSP